MTLPSRPNAPPTVSADSGQLQAFFERIERMHEEKKAISDDIAEIFAEAKATGYDTKVMKIVLQKRRMDHAARQEQEALVDLYMEALGMIGTPRATRAPAQAEKSEPALTPAAAPVESVANVALSTIHSPAKASTGNAATVSGTETQSNSGSGDASRLSDGSGSVAPIHQSTAARTGRAGQPQLGADAYSPATDARDRASGYRAPPVDTHSAAALTADNEGNNPALVAEDAPHVFSASNPPAVAEPVAPSNVSPFVPKPHDDPVNSKGLRRHKLCRNLEVCGGSWREACHSCRRAFDVEAGGIAVEHQGQIA